jgi:hypothetical protein
MKSNGIFGGPTALGLPLSGDKIPCAGPEFFKALQAELKRRGYNVRQDGIWDGCCQSAIIKELGGSLWHTDQVKKFLGKDCTTGFVSQGGSAGGALILGPQHTVAPTCNTGADQKSTGVHVKECPEGQVFDAALNTCVPTLDPFDCGKKCEQFPQGSNDWSACMLACNTSGGKNVTPGAGPPTPPVPPVPGVLPTTVDPTAADVFGGNLPLIVGALAVGVGAALYFGSKKTPPKKAPAVLARRNRRR